MVFGQVFSPKSIIVNLESEDKDELFEEMVAAITSVHPEIDRQEALNALREREAKMSTGIMHGIAVPHGTTEGISGCYGAIGISRKGIDYDSLDGAPVNLVFMFVCGTADNELHLDVLRGLATILQKSDFVSELMQKNTPQEVYDLLRNAEI